ncbi:DoxX family protein [Rhodohalobacter sp. SW132]|uniref:DoxX family protein n=1 Tax=Rhodohalobacter sp. SW132 TaxID=2293433 RepID=UPI000E24C1EC|nr:DoxX family protein [Rhodohalobacter sp. SW132]REL24001.1 DoxX family protein [Rhodohalobacter sp. SW132]
MKLPDVPQRYAFIVLRAITGIIFITHGAARIYYGTVDGFGEFLNHQGFLIGLPLAWTITIGEIVIGSCLAVGFKTRICVLFHGIIIITGIYLIHLPQGWFTVGQSSGGVEYSLLLLAVLLFIYSYSTNKQTIPQQL